METEPYPAAAAESQITITPAAPARLQCLSSTPLIPVVERTPALLSTPALSPISAIQLVSALAHIPAIEPAPAIEPVQALVHTPAVEPAPAIEPAPSVLPTEASPQPALPAVPTTPIIRRVSVSIKYCKVIHLNTGR